MNLPVPDNPYCYLIILLLVIALSKFGKPLRSEKGVFWCAEIPESLFLVNSIGWNDVPISSTRV